MTDAASIHLAHLTRPCLSLGYMIIITASCQHHPITASNRHIYHDQIFHLGTTALSHNPKPQLTLIHTQTEDTCHIAFSHLSPGLRTSSAVVVLMLKLTLADNGGVETVSVMSLCPCESPPPVWVSAGSPAAFYPLCRGNCSCTPVIGFPNVDTDLYQI